MARRTPQSHALRTDPAAPRAQHHHRTRHSRSAAASAARCAFEPADARVVRIIKPLCDDPLEVVGVHELEELPDFGNGR